MNKIVVIGTMIGVGLVGFIFGKSMQDTSEKARVASTTSSGVTLDSLPPPVELMSQSEAAKHRINRYEEIADVSEALALPTDFARSEALFTLAGRANSEQLQNLIQQAANISERYDRSSALRILFSRYVELDPDAAVDYIQAIHLDIDTMVLPDMFMSWAKSDLPQAIEKANSIGNVRQRKLAGNAILRAVARNNISMLSQVEEQLEGYYRLTQLRSEAIGLQSNSDPAGALQLALTMDDEQGRWGALRRVSSVWARNDPAAALAHANEITDQRYRQQFVLNVLRRWMGDDPESALEMIQATGNEARRASLMQQALELYASSEPEAALQYAGQLSGKEFLKAQEGIFSAWAVSDPAAALVALESYPDRKEQLMRTMSRGLSSAGGSKAEEWIALMAPEQRAKYLPDVVDYISRSNPKKALELAMTHMSKSQRNQHLPSILQSIAMSDPVLASQYLSDMPTNVRTDYVFNQVAAQLAQTDSQVALEWVESLSGSGKKRAMTGLIQGLAQTDPELSASLVRGLPASDRGKMMEQISQQLSMRDPAAGLEWLDQFRHLEGYETAVAGSLPNLAREEPRRALQIADSLNGKAKDKVLTSIVQMWSYQDNEAATQWVLEQSASTTRDRGIVGLMGSRRRSADEIRGLVERIDSDELRDNAIIQGYIQMLARGENREEAENFLTQMNISDELRQKIEIVKSQFPGL